MIVRFNLNLILYGEIASAKRLLVSSSNDLFLGNKKSLYNGFAMAILRSEQKAGTVKLKVTAPGLKGIENFYSKNNFIIII